jgi:hypothetical protein
VACWENTDRATFSDDAVAIGSQSRCTPAFRLGNGTTA